MSISNKMRSSVSPCELYVLQFPSLFPGKISSMEAENDSSRVATAHMVIIIVVAVIIVIKIVIVMIICQKKARIGTSTVAPDSRFLTLTVDKFLTDMEREKPIRFTCQQLRIATENFTNLLGSGSFGDVYKGTFSNGTIVAVKVLKGFSDKRIEEQFMAEVSTIGRIHHFNLVRLYGFCFEKNLRALVYEFMANGSLDKHLFCENVVLGFEKLHDIALGTARGIAYLHEECQQRIIHYDIKPENILLDENFFPKVADFGLAKLCNREKTHITMTGRRGTAGYTAPELWVPFRVTHKCDVHSFGMLLLEIVSRRRNMKKEDNVPESQEWFPKWVWKRFENGDLDELMKAIEIEAEGDREKAERMIKVAFWCVQYKSESRPLMSVVVKMLEGAVEIPTPLKQIHHILMESPSPQLPISAYNIKWNGSSLDSLGSSSTSPYICATPVMKKYGIEMDPN